MGALFLANSTLAGNSASNEGGGIRNLQGNVTLTNSIIAGNSSTNLPDSEDILNTDGTVTRVGANIIPQFENSGSGTDFGPPAIDAAPLLAPLGDYGGPTPTMPPLPGSPALDAAPGSTDPTDQRGFPRSSGGITPDIGAVELQHLLVTTAADEDNGDNDPANGTGTSLREAIAHLSPTRAEIITFAQPLSGATITLNGNNTSQIFLVSGSISVSLRGLTLTGGNGGAIDSSGATLALERCTLHGNTDDISAGGAISSSGLGASLTLAHCTLTDNSADEGGAIQASGSLSLRHCTLTGNTAASGGGVRFTGGSPGDSFTRENSIVAGNSATRFPTHDDIRISVFANLTRVGANLVQNFSTNSTGSETNPLFPTLRSGPTAGSGALPTKRFPSSQLARSEDQACTDCQINSRFPAFVSLSWHDVEVDGSDEGVAGCPKSNSPGASPVAVHRRFRRAADPSRAPEDRARLRFGHVST